MGFGVQRKLRVVCLRTSWFRCDAGSMRGHLDMTKLDFNGGGCGFTPLDWDFGWVILECAGYLSVWEEAFGTVQLLKRVASWMAVRGVKGGRRI